MLSYYFNCTVSIELFLLWGTKNEKKNNLISLQESMKLRHQYLRTACLEIAAPSVTYIIFKSSYEKCANYTYISGLHPISKRWTTYIKSKGLENHIEISSGPVQITVQILKCQRFSCPPRLSFHICSDHFGFHPFPTWHLAPVNTGEQGSICGWLAWLTPGNMAWVPRAVKNIWAGVFQKSR